MANHNAGYGDWKAAKSGQRRICACSPVSRYVFFFLLTFFTFSLQIGYLLISVQFGSLGRRFLLRVISNKLVFFYRVSACFLKRYQHMAG